MSKEIYLLVIQRLLQCFFYELIDKNDCRK